MWSMIFSLEISATSTEKRSFTWAVRSSNAARPVEKGPGLAGPAKGVTLERDPRKLLKIVADKALGG